MKQGRGREGWGQCTCPECGKSRALGPPSHLSQPHLLFLGHTWLVNDNQLVITNYKKLKTLKLTWGQSAASPPWPWRPAPPQRGRQSRRPSWLLQPRLGQNLLKVLTWLESSKYAILALKPRKLAISQMQKGFVTGAATSCEAPTQLQSSLFVLSKFPYFTRESSSLRQLHVVNKRSCLNAKYQVCLPLHPLGPETGPTFWGSSL